MTKKGNSEKKFLHEKIKLFGKFAWKNQNSLKICMEKSVIFLPGSTTRRFQTRLMPLVMMLTIVVIMTMIMIIMMIIMIIIIMMMMIKNMMAIIMMIMMTDGHDDNYYYC